MASDSESPSASEAPPSAEPAAVVAPAPATHAKAAADSAPAAGRIGTTVGHILLEARLGVGGMGEVYRGFDRKLERRVAVKTIRTRHRLSAEMKARFLREARLLSKLEHPGICQVYDLLEGDDTDFLILEFVDGETLYDRLKRGLGDEQKLVLAERVARVLAVAHEQKIVHRDLKPDNIMVMPDGGIKVLDFGIARTVSERQTSALHDPDEALSAMTDTDTQAQHAVRLPSEVAAEGHGEAHGEGGEEGPTEFVTGPRSDDDSETAMLADGTMLTQDGLVVGTARYMSPEQARGRKVEEASDMYSFGIMLQEMLTEQGAYAKAPIMEMLLKVSRAETLPLPEDLDPDLARLIEDLKSLDAHRRPSAQEAAERLRWVLDKPQRLRRKKMLIVSISGAFVALLALLIVVTFLAVQAEQARQEAESRRRQAERLISFMLGDLYDKLQGVGRTDILDDVGDRAIEYFEEVSDEDLTDSERFQRVEALNQIGNVRWAQGDRTAALAAFRHAEETAQRLTERAPSNNEWQASLIAARFGIGFIYHQQNRFDEAEEQFHNYLETARRLAENEPDDPRWHLEVAYGHSNLATVYKARGDLQAALEAHRKGLEIKEELADRYPEDLDWQRQVAVSLNHMGTVLQELGRLSEALEFFRQDLAITQNVANADPENSQLRERIGSCHHFIGSLLSLTGQPDEALQHLQVDLEAIQRRAQEDPTNKQAQRDFAVSQSSYGLALLRLGHLSDALLNLRRGGAILEQLLDEEPDNVDWSVSLGHNHLVTATVLELEGQNTTAREEIDLCLTLLRPVAASLTNPSANPRVRLRLNEAQLRLGSLLQTAGENDAALDAWQQAAGRLEPMVHGSGNYEVLALWAEALIYLQRREEAQAVLDRLYGFGYREPLLLRLAERRGYSLPAV